jgi:hypothetical protein
MEFWKRDVSEHGGGAAFKAWQGTFKKTIYTIVKFFCIKVYTLLCSDFVGALEQSFWSDIDSI